MIEQFLKWAFTKMGRYKVITDRSNTHPYMIRHYLLHKDKLHHFEVPEEKPKHKTNVFLHHILMSDDPIYHDHPWNWASFVIKGGYWEHRPLWVRPTPVVPEGFWTDVKTWRGPFSFCRRKATDFHYIELKDGVKPWTLFFHGKRERVWGFSRTGSLVDWIRWDIFTNTDTVSME